VKKALGTARELAKDAYRIFSDGGARVLSGSIAFYALLSIVPILVIALRLASLVVDPAHVDSAALSQLARFVGPRGAQTVIALALETEKRTDATLTHLLGVAVLIYGSTRLFSQMTRALDLLWGTEAAGSASGILARAREQVKKRALSFAMVLAVGVLLLGTVLVHAGLAAARRWVGVDVSFASRLLEGLASFATTVALFGLIFRVLPRGRVNTSDAFVGGTVTALLFTLGSLGITAYVSHKDMSLYGTASALVMLMLWANYSAHVFFLGAAFTAAHARRRGAT
jgi:membrane protein